MLAAKVGQLRYLKLETLAADPMLAQRLPPDLAWRYHALPLAEDNGRITVAMADPDDVEAREAIVAALGPRSCLVRGSAKAIDEQLSEIWGDQLGHRLNLRVCAYPDPLPAELWVYTQVLGALLGAHLEAMGTAEDMDALAQEGKQSYHDLVILGGRCHPLLRRLLSRPAAANDQGAQPRALPYAILVAQQPRMPLKRILLVIWGESADSAAVEWAVRLAQPSAAAVTVLAVVPPVPAMYHGLARMEQGMAALLTRDTTLGRQMHRVVRRLAESKVDGTLRLRQGAPDRQICREVVEGDHDLIVVATNPCHWWLRQLKGDPICSLLSWVDRPVLFAEPTTA